MLDISNYIKKPELSVERTFIPPLNGSSTSLLSTIGKNCVEAQNNEKSVGPSINIALINMLSV